MSLKERIRTTPVEGYNARTAAQKAAHHLRDFYNQWGADALLEAFVEVFGEAGMDFTGPVFDWQPACELPTAACFVVVMVTEKGAAMLAGELGAGRTQPVSPGDPVVVWSEWASGRRDCWTTWSLLPGPLAQRPVRHS